MKKEMSLYHLIVATVFAGILLTAGIYYAINILVDGDRALCPTCYDGTELDVQDPISALNRAFYQNEEGLALIHKLQYRLLGIVNHPTVIAGERGFLFAALDEDTGYDYLADYTGHKKTYDLRNRLRFTKEAGADLLISIHMNKFPQSRYSGLQVYYSANTPESRAVAGIIRNYTKLYLQPDNEREIKAATSSIFLLHRCEIPSVMVECGFLSNEEELSRLKDDTYRRQLALVIACAAAESLMGSTQ